MKFSFVDAVSIAAGVFAGGLALLAIVQMTSAAGSLWSHALAAMKIVGRALTSIGLLGLCLLFIGGLGLVAWVMLMVLWMRAVINVRTVQKRSLLSALALASEKEMPLVPVARAFAKDQGGPFSRQVDEMARGLDQGAKLRDLSQRWQSILPRETALAVRVGLESGDMKGALQAATHSSAFDRSMLQPVIGRITYLGVVIVYLVVILTFALIKIMPSYVKIFDDFGTSLPSASISLIWFSNFMSPLLGPLILFALAAAPVYIWLQWRGTLRPRLFGLRRVINWIDMAPVLRMLALATRRGRPLDEVLRAVAELHPKRSVRARMWPVAFDVEDGRPWQASLERHFFVSDNDAALLSAAQRSGNLAWAFAETASSYERKASLRLQALSQVALPLAMLPVGILVAWVALAFFSPVVKLISDLS